MTERLPLFLRRRPPPRALEWAARAVAEDARVVALRRLRGGSASAVHLLTIEQRSGERHRLVLRRYLRENWLAEEPDVAEKEARVLGALASSDLPTPGLVAYDASGSLAGAPAVLMRRLPGRIDLSPAGVDAGVEAMAELLVRIHALPCTLVPDLQPYRVWHDPAEDRVPAWSREPDAWKRLIDADRAGPPDREHVLLHRDYHPGNVLWSRGSIVGITDWVNASCGPPGIDGAHCRLNLVQTLGVGAAERFRERYEQLSGRRHHAAFDARGLLDAGLATLDLAQSHDAGRTDLTVDLIAARLDEYARLVASRL